MNAQVVCNKAVSNQGHGMPSAICGPNLYKLNCGQEAIVFARLLFAILLLIAPALAVGQLYRCEAANGQPTFQDRPCVGAGEPLQLQVHRPTDKEVVRLEQRHQQLREHMDGIDERRAQALEALLTRRAEERRQAERERQAAADARSRENPSYPRTVSYRKLNRGGLHLGAFHRRALFRHPLHSAIRRSDRRLSGLGCDVFLTGRIRSNRPSQTRHLFSAANPLAVVSD